MSDDVRIGEKIVGAGRPVYVIAEAGVNHNGDVALAHRMVDLAAEAGADAVKFQAFLPEELCAADAPLADYAKSSTIDDQRRLLEGLTLPTGAFRELRDHSREAGIEFLCTAFDHPSLALLTSLDVAAYKFASTDLTNDPLLAVAAKTGRPLILSTGASTLEEIATALQPLASIEVLLLHCVSAYPTTDEDANLRTIADLNARFCRPVGFSDHTFGIEVAPLAVAAGAIAIEKHFTTDPRLPGPDQMLSLGPEALHRLIEKIRLTERVLGSPRSDVFPCEQDVRSVARKSFVAARDLPVGTVVGDADLALKRPGTGLGPEYRVELTGKRTVVGIIKDTLLRLDMFA